MRLVLIYSLLLFSTTMFSQVLKGKVQEENENIVGVLVVNLSNQKETLTDQKGKFSIEAQEGDLLIFDSSFIYKKRYLVEKEDFKKEIIIPLESKPLEIEQVEVEKINFSAVELGILQKDPKKYTVEERRLYTAQTERHIGGLINLITGRTKMLKKLDAIKKENKKVHHIKQTAEEEFIVNQAGIQKEDVGEFLYYFIYNIEKELPKKHRATYIYSLTKEELNYAIISLAKEYNQLKYDKAESHQVEN